MPHSSVGLGSAHAKAILLGEHAVVYGHPAIAFPVHSLRLQATASRTSSGVRLRTPFHETISVTDPSELDTLEQSLPAIALFNTLRFLDLAADGIEVSVEGIIPQARGLGSSAAVAGAVADAVARLHGVELHAAERFDLVQSVENVAHGTPSGLDAHATHSDDPIWFSRGTVESLRIGTPPRLLIADTGFSGRTSLAVSHVRTQYEQQRAHVDERLGRLNELTEAARGFLADDDHRGLGSAMTEGHSVLRDLGVSHERLDTLIDAALDHGALGAKLTGGGMGGCIVVLAESEATERELATVLHDAGAAGVWSVSETEGGHA